MRFSVLRRNESACRDLGWHERKKSVVPRLESRTLRHRGSAARRRCGSPRTSQSKLRAARRRTNRRTRFSKRRARARLARHGARAARHNSARRQSRCRRCRTRRPHRASRRRTGRLAECLVTLARVRPLTTCAEVGNDQSERDGVRVTKCTPSRPSSEKPLRRAGRTSISKLGPAPALVLVGVDVERRAADAPEQQVAAGRAGARRPSGRSGRCRRSSRPTGRTPAGPWAASRRWITSRAAGVAARGARALARRPSRRTPSGSGHS